MATVPSSVKTVLQYVIILGITGLLIWFSLGSLTVGEGGNKWDFLRATWQSANKSMLILMAVIAMISHLIRAERWKLMMVPTGYKTKLSYSFFSLMVGYLVNLVIPRGGEVSRCYNLYKIDKTPVEISFGTVVVERIVDLLCLIILIAIAFIVESKKLFAFIDTLPVLQGGLESKFKVFLILSIIVIGVIAVLYFIVKRNEKIRSFLVRAWRGFRSGLLSVFRLEKKGLFLFYSLLIWVLYFLTSYVIILAFPDLDHLGPAAVLSLFAIGAIAMTVPLPGGTGSYHVLVPQGLIFLYNIGRPEAVAFTFIFHGWQTGIMIVGGAISLIITAVLVKRKKPA